MKNNSLLLFGREDFLTPFDQVFDKLVRRTFPDIEKEFGITFSGTARPKVDVKDFNDKLQIVAEIAGLTKDDVTVEVKDGILTLKAEKQERKDDESNGYILKELSSSKFQRSFTLGKNLDAKNISAKFENGVLCLDIPKIEKQADETLKIEIK